MHTVLSCPSCGRPLELIEVKGRLGRAKRTPQRCGACGTLLAYTTTGEVVAREAPPWMGAVLDATGATSISGWDEVQTLWSGYGHICRVALEGAQPSSVVVKHVRWPSAARHPRGWSSDRSHARKVRSYEVEANFYRGLAARCDETCRVPRALAEHTQGDEVFLVLEDLDAAGFEQRPSRLTDDGLFACLRWLASFHAAFLGEAPDGLWPVGTYWHLATRPDELAALKDTTLVEAAPRIDERLSSARYVTLVHGDAKLANFCFRRDARAVAAVDFQYVGGGCGMKDVAYFLGSCLDEDACERREQELLGVYFEALAAAIVARGHDVDVDELEREWRALYPVAWTDFYRFLAGWSPGHWKIHRYTKRLAREVLESQ